MLRPSVIVNEPVRGSYAYFEYPGLMNLSGLEQFRPFLKGRLPLPPLFRLTGLRISEIGLGTATYAMPASGWWQSSAGVFTGGVMAFLADAALGGAIYAALPPRTALATSQLSIDFLRPASVASGSLIARGRLLQAGRSQALSEAVVEDSRGRLLAHATSRCILRHVASDPPPLPDAFPPAERDRSDTPDPHARPPEGKLLGREQWNTMTGLDILRAAIAGGVPAPPAAELTGLRILSADEGRVVHTMPASEWFCTSARGFYGGAVAFLADWAINGALTTTLPPRTAYGTLDLKVNYLRRVRPDGRDLVAEAEVVHRGKTVGVVNGRISDADGKLVAIASSSSMLYPGRSWAPEEKLSPMDEEVPGQEGEDAG